VPAWSAHRAATPIDAGACGYDSVILRHEDGTVSWYLALHHVLTDATSSQLLFAATAAAYAGTAPSFERYYDWAEDLQRDASARAVQAERHWSARRAAPRVARLYRPVRTPTPRSTRVQVPFDDALRSRAPRACRAATG
jgi:hypothetical protein